MNNTHKGRIRIIFNTGYLTVLLLFAVACHKESDNNPGYEYLVDYNLISVYPVNTIQSVISAESVVYPEITEISDHVKYSVQIYKIRYKTHYKDSVITASGLICIPSAHSAFPVISFQNGTNTLYADAPSVNPSNSNYLLLEYMASNGYIILITDYIGFGSSSSVLHPYYHRVSTNNAIIDLIHAFNELSKSKKIPTTGNDTLYLMGYSQGGGATLSALDAIEHGGPFEMSVAAASCGAGAYDLIDMTHYVLGLETFPGPLYFPYFIYSEQKYGTITKPLTEFFKEPYPALIPGLFDGMHDNNEVNAGLNDTIADLLTNNMIENFDADANFSELRQALSQNSISGWNTSTLLNLYHGTDDLNVPPRQSANMYDDFINSGASPDKVHYYPLDGLTHETGLIPWGIQTMIWFNTLEQNK